MEGERLYVRKAKENRRQHIYPTIQIRLSKTKVSQDSWMKTEATIRQISRQGKNRGKNKRFQYGWLSECWFWYDIDWAHKLIANETEVLRTSPNTSLRQHDKIDFLWWLHHMRPHPTIMGKTKNMRLRTRVWAQAPRPSSFAESIFEKWVKKHNFWCPTLGI